LDTIVFLLESG